MICIAPSIHKVMLAHAKTFHPQEVCGILAGTGSTVRAIYVIENVLASPVAYEMDPTQQVRAMVEVENAGLELLAVYHSHPNGPPMPSATDLALAFYPELVQIIISLEKSERPQMRAFLVAHGAAAEIEMKIE